MNGPRLASDIIELFYGLIELQQEPEEPQQMTHLFFFFHFYYSFNKEAPERRCHLGSKSETHQLFSAQNTFTLCLLPYANRAI